MLKSLVIPQESFNKPIFEANMNLSAGFKQSGIQETKTLLAHFEFSILLGTSKTTYL